MSMHKRQHDILEQIMEQGSVQVDDLAAAFGVSRMTIHRDLDVLAQEGIVRKVRGGATMEPSSWFESDFRYRSKLAQGEKAAIAAAAAQLVEPGQVVILDDGTTAARVARHLPEQLPLTVITNNLAAIDELRTQSDIELIALGGTYDRRFHGFFGLVAEQGMASLRADLLFLSTSSVKGLVAYHQEEAVVRTKRAMLAAADRSVLLIDHGKFERTALHQLCGLDRFETVITGGEPPEPARAALDEAGIDWRIAPPTHGEPPGGQPASREKGSEG